MRRRALSRDGSRAEKPWVTILDNALEEAVTNWDLFTPVTSPDEMFDIRVSQPQSVSHSAAPIAAPSAQLKCFNSSLTKASCGQQPDLTKKYADPKLYINPAKLKFAPARLWTDTEIPFREIVSVFFRRRNQVNSRFLHKLFNALALGESNPTYKELTGVSWLSNTILRVDKRAFGGLLNLNSIDPALFHQQGNFPSHGFREIGRPESKEYCSPDLDLTGVDFGDVKLLIHRKELFTRQSTREDIEKCEWRPLNGWDH
jgi:hypothetical protein